MTDSTPLPPPDAGGIDPYGLHALMEHDPVRSISLLALDFADAHHDLINCVGDQTKIDRANRCLQAIAKAVQSLAHRPAPGGGGVRRPTVGDRVTVSGWPLYEGCVGTVEATNEYGVTVSLDDPIPENGLHRVILTWDHATFTEALAARPGLRLEEGEVEALGRVMRDADLRPGSGNLRVRIESDLALLRAALAREGR